MIQRLKKIFYKNSSFGLIPFHNWNTSFIFEKWIKNTIVFIKDILRNNNLFLGNPEMYRKYNVKCIFLDILRIRPSILHVLYMFGGIYYLSFQNHKTKHTVKAST